jgi:hypothetical protein
MLGNASLLFLCHTIEWDGVGELECIHNNQSCGNPSTFVEKKKKGCALHYVLAPILNFGQPGGNFQQGARQIQVIRKYSG